MASADICCHMLVMIFEKDGNNHDSIEKEDAKASDQV